MTVSRRGFLGRAMAMSMLAGMLGPEEMKALGDGQDAASAAATAELPHDSLGFWGGFYDSANPKSPDYGGATRGADTLADAKLETQYLHYQTSDKKLRYAASIEKSELLNHDGDVSVSIVMNQFRANSKDSAKKNAAQFRVDTTQNYPFMNLLAPLAWTAIAALQPNNAGKLPTLDQLHFKSDQVMDATSHILLTKGSGKMAVNISQAPKNAQFLKVLNIIIDVAKIGAPLVALPAVSVPAMAAFSEAFGYWEDRTEFLINGNLVNVCATQQSMDDQTIRPPYIGLVPGDYVVVAKKDTDALEAVMPQLMVYQGYLVHQDTDLGSMTVDKAKADPRIPDITYATVRVGVTAASGASQAGKKPDAATPDATPVTPPVKKKTTTTTITTTTKS
jgi:hypothetical protein